MVESSVFDLTVDLLLERQKDLKAELKTRFKKTKPFRTDPMETRELIYYYDQLNSQDMEFLISRHGREKVGDFIWEMEENKRRIVQ